MDASVQLALSTMLGERLKAVQSMRRVLSRIDDKTSGFLGRHVSTAHPVLRFVARRLLRTSDVQYSALRTISNVLEGSKTEHISYKDLTDAFSPEELFLFCCSCSVRIDTSMPVGEKDAFSEVEFVVPFDDDHTFFFHFYFDEGGVRVTTNQMIRYTSADKE